jgi:exonuclease III
MKVISWNANHRTKEKKIPDKMIDGLLSLNPDIIVLTEFVPGASRERFIKDLVDAGLVHIKTPNYVPNQNTIVVASRYQLNVGGILAPAIDPAIPPNFCHLTLPTENLDLIAIRIPDYSKSLKIKREYWDWTLAMASTFNEKRCLLCGDFNTSPQYSRARCGDRIQKLIDLGWVKVSPGNGYSYWNPKGYGVQIDHAFTKGAITVSASEYINEKNGVYFVGKKGEELSDHAVLSIDIL